MVRGGVRIGRRAVRVSALRRCGRPARRRGALRAHLAAVAGDGAGAVGTPAGSRPRAASTGWLSSDGTQRRPGGGAADLAAAVWRAGVEADGTPGAVYLRGRGAWPGPVAALRWLPAVEAARIGLRPRLPDGAAGALLYRFAAPGELGTAAVQCEAVADGNAREGGLPGRCGAAGPDALSEVPERLAFGGGAKRASVTGSDFDGGRRVFGLPMQAGRVHVRRDRGGVDVNAAGEPVELAVDDQDPDGGDDPGYRANHGRDGSEGFDHDSDVTTVAGVNLAEGPIDALALAALWRMGIERRALGDRPIVGAAGVGGWRLAAVAGWPGPVTLWVQGDMPGYLAALRLEAALMQTGRAVALEVAPAGMDWGDVAYIEAAEREAVQSGD